MVWQDIPEFYYPYNLELIKCPYMTGFRSEWVWNRSLAFNGYLLETRDTLYPTFGNLSLTNIIVIHLHFGHLFKVNLSRWLSMSVYLWTVSVLRLLFCQTQYKRIKKKKVNPSCGNHGEWDCWPSSTNASCICIMLTSCL